MGVITKMVVLLTAMVLLVLTVPLAYLAERRAPGGGSAVLALVAGLCILLVASTIPAVLSNLPAHRYVEGYVWIPAIGASFSLFVDGVSLSLSLLALLLIFSVAVYSYRYMEHRSGLPTYYALTGALSLGLFGIFVTSNLLLFYFFWELILIPSYFIIGQWGGSDSYEVAFRFIIVTHAGAVLVLLGIGTAYVESASLDMFVIQTALVSAQPAMVAWMLVSLTIGFAIKLAIAPAHFWLPDTYSEAPAPMSALLGGVMTTAGAYGILRLSLGMVFPALATQSFGTIFLYVLAIFGVASALFGSLLALTENDVNRLLAYSSISHMGYVVFALSLFPNVLAVIAVVLHMVNHGLSKGLLFLSTGSVVKQTETRDMNLMSGVAMQMPLTGAGSAIAALSLGGVPPFACFISEFFIFVSAFQRIASDGFYLVPTLLLLLASVLSLAYAIRFIGNLLLGPESKHVLRRNSGSALAVIVLLAVFVVFLGVFPTILTEMIGLVNFTP
jgi:NADH-quinone oxidoreductase subunit M